MTDAEFVSTLCDYVVENVAVFYKGQPQYHQGWQNRYKREKAQCLAMIAEHERYPCERGRCDRARSGWLSWWWFFVE